MKYWIKFFSSIIFLVAILLFYLWSKLLIVSVILVIIFDSVSWCFFPNTLRKIISFKLFIGLKYTYLTLVPLILFIFLRIFLFDVYYVPSSSMEKTLYPNDYILVNKMSYGVKVPKRIQYIPIIGSFFENKNDTLSDYNLFRSLKSYNDFKRNDIVVFKSKKKSNIFFVKRIIGLPGDTLKILKTQTIINNKVVSELDNYTYNYIEFINSYRDKSLTLSNKDYESIPDLRKKIIHKLIRKDPFLNKSLFPKSKINLWTPDNYGPILIPKKGLTIIITSNNFDEYSWIINKYENGKVLTDNLPFKYTFKEDYYFMLGDNRSNSIDSRNYGFIPYSYIQGKMINTF